MNISPNIKAYLPWLIVLLLIAAAVGFVYVTNSGQDVSVNTKKSPLPPFSETSYLNTGPEAQYIGIDACAECHQARHDSYLHTAHSRALADLNPDEEPPDASFYHEPSGRNYEVYRKDGKLYHKESFKTGESTTLETNLPIRYVVGSGLVGRSYFVEVDGFLHESPITWYAQKKKWALSPGYDRPNHLGFERAIDQGCLNCHTGRVENVGGALHRFQILEHRIGCESCHGPGSLHRDRHVADKPYGGPDDLTIVNPSKLSRKLADAICSQCHLDGDATVYLRGRNVGDFRPGLPLSDFRIEYHVQTPGSPMKVVGHMEQMRLSRCYTKSETLTCISCHDPHARSKPENPVVYYRQKCLNCHTTESCGLEHAERIKTDAQDNCMACHMPRGGTDVPHVAFTHHRIGIHKSQPARRSDAAGKLVAILKNPKLSGIDVERNLGLAYAESSSKQRQFGRQQTFQNLSVSLLEDVVKKGLSDGPTKEALARLIWRSDPKKGVEYAKEALQIKGLSPRLRINATFILACHEMESGRLDSAIRLFKDLTKLHRHSEDWYFLGLCHLKKADLKQALNSLEYSLSINPFHARTHQLISDVYAKLGQAQRAEKHESAAKKLASR